MTLNQLVLTYPDVRYDIAEGQKRLARVTVEYSVAGPPEAITRFLEELDQEWPFAQQRCKGKTDHSGLIVQVEYLVRPGEVVKFLNKVPYRDKKIVLAS